MSDQPSVLDPKAVDPLNNASRRDFIERFFKHLGVFDKDQMDVYRQRAEEFVCQELASEDPPCTRVGQANFEYEVDIAFWENYLRGQKALTRATRWPWSKYPHPDDFSGGASTIFERWLTKEANLVTAAETTAEEEKSKP